MKSKEGESKETCHLREGMSSFWKFEYQWWQLSSVTNITGLTTSIANLASSKLYKLKMEISNTSVGIHEKDTFLILYIKIIVINLHAVSRYKNTEIALIRSTGRPKTAAFSWIRVWMSMRYLVLVLVVTWF